MTGRWTAIGSRAGRRMPVACLALAMSFWGGPACNDPQKKDQGRAMSFSSGEYSRGYRDGMRDAKQALFDDHAGWMWLWMTEKEYADGYDRGWEDGRRTLDLERKQQEVQDRGQRDALDAPESPRSPARDEGASEE